MILLSLFSVSPILSIMRNLPYNRIAYTVKEQYLQAIRNVQNKRNLSFHKLSRLLKINEQSLRDMYALHHDDLLVE